MGLFGLKKFNKIMQRFMKVLFNNSKIQSNIASTPYFFSFCLSTGLKKIAKLRFAMKKRNDDKKIEKYFNLF